MDTSLGVLWGLGPLVFLAGFIDSIAGGGGLVSLASYTGFGLEGAFALGTNKFGSVIGCAAASASFVRTGNYDLRSLVPAALMALAGSFWGSSLALGIGERTLRIMLLAASPVVAGLVLANKGGKKYERERGAAWVVGFSALVGLAVGFYDGIYGPGAGTFIQLGLVMLVGLDVKKACGNARLVNLASNLAALATFVAHGKVVFRLAVPCAAFSVLGNLLGSRLAIKKDIKIVRPMMLAVVALLMAKLVWDLFL